MDKPFQRKGAKSNTDVGKKFESRVQNYFNQIGLELMPNYALEIGINSKYIHKFDLGSREGKVIVECKAHTWTEGRNVPSAKLTAWDQAMFFFYLTPSNYRKILFVKGDYSEKRGETLGEYYIGYVVTITPNFCLLGCVFDMYLAAKQKMILIRKVGTKVAVRGWMIYRWP